MCLGDKLDKCPANCLLIVMIHSTIQQRMGRNLMKTSFLDVGWFALRDKTCKTMHTIGRARG